MKGSAASISWVMRGCIVLFWGIVIGAFLWSPVVIRQLFPDQTLNVLVWPVMVDANRLQEFERETGIKLRLTYYESNDELVRKLRSTRAIGYDLVIAGDHVVELLIQEKLLKPIDRSRLPFFNDFHPTLLNHYFDPNNRFSIPYYFGVYGLGIDTDYFENRLPTPSWALLFEPQGYCITMTDDPRRAVLLAASYALKRKKHYNRDDLATIKQTLLRQKSWVELYSDIRGEETLAAKSCPVACTLSSDLWRVAQEYTNLAFLIPKEGSFMTLDSFVISHATSQEDKIYSLLNFIYKPDVLKYHATKFGFCPPLKTVDVEGYNLICPEALLLKKLQFFRSVMPKEEIDRIWVSVMAK